MDKPYGVERGINMMKSEFERLTTRPFTDTEYRVIEIVYTHHPSIDNVKGKQQIAMLYETFGMRIIHDMLPTAKKAREINDRMLKLNAQIEEAKNDLRDLEY